MGRKKLTIPKLFFLFLLFALLPRMAMSRDIDENFLDSLENKVSRPRIPSGISYGYLVGQANLNMDEGRYGKAREFLWKAINLFPQKPDAYINLAIININEGQPETALRLLQNAQRYASWQDNYFQQEILAYNFGLCFFKLNNYQEALKHFSEAIDIYSEFAESFYYKGLVYFEQGKYEEAFTNFFIARYLFKNQSKIHYQAKAAYFLSTIKASGKLNEKSLAKAFYDLTKEELSKGDLGKALYFAQESIYLNPQNADIHFKLAVLYKQNKDYENSILYLEKASELNPESIDYILELASVYKLQGNHREAKKAFEKVLSIDNENPQIFYTMATIYFQADEFVAAKRHLKEAWRLAHNSQDDAMLEEIDEFRKNMLESRSKAKGYSRKRGLTKQKKFQAKPLLQRNNYGTFSEGYINPY